MIQLDRSLFDLVSLREGLIKEAISKYHKVLLKRYPHMAMAYKDEEAFFENCKECAVCVVYDGYFVVADIGTQWWDRDIPVLFEWLVLSIGEHKQRDSYLAVLEDAKEQLGASYISFGTQSPQATALGGVLKENGYKPWGGIYFKG